MSKPSRQIALDILTEVEDRQCFMDDALGRHNREIKKLEAKDRSLLFELIKGTLRWRGRIDTLLSQVSHRPLNSIPVRIRNTLRLGAYQILFLDRVPDWAAVDETAELARKVGHEGHVRFVNGILRALIRKQDKIVFPEPANSIPHLAATHSFPEWLVKRWLERFGKEAAEELLKACNQPPRLTLRINTLQVSRETFMEQLKGTVQEIRSDPLVPEGVEITGTGDIKELPGYDQGWFYVQDPGSMMVSRLMGVKPGEKVLDACAAPGGKASHLAQLMEDRGEIVALEKDRARIQKIQENMGRLGIGSVQIMQGDAEAMEFSEPFDRILIDVPCSGLGTLRRHPEARWLKKEEDLLKHQERQYAILKNISKALKQGGTLVYATCSTEPEENEEVVLKFLEETPDFKVDKKPAHLDRKILEMFDDQGFFHAWPHLHGTDGFFAVRLVRK